MRKKRTKIVTTRWVSVDRLITPAYYHDLFPLPRDRSALVESFDRYGYRPEYPLTVRPSELLGNHFEIVCGVGRFELACERGMRRVPVIIREMSQKEALLYAVEDTLFAAGSSASLSLPQAIFLSRLLEGRTKSLPPRLVWKLARVSESTFWRAVKAYDLAVGKAAGEHPELEELAPHIRVAEIIRRDLFPEFTRLWTGSLEVHTFQQAHATGEGRGRAAARKKSKATASERANGTRRGRAGEGHPPRSAKRHSRKKDGRTDASLPLFES